MGSGSPGLVQALQTMKDQLITHNQILDLLKQFEVGMDSRVLAYLYNRNKVSDQGIPSSHFLQLLEQIPQLTSKNPQTSEQFFALILYETKARKSITRQQALEAFKYFNRCISVYLMNIILTNMFPGNQISKTQFVDLFDRVLEIDDHEAEDEYQTLTQEGEIMLTHDVMKDFLFHELPWLDEIHILIILAGTAFTRRDVVEKEEFIKLYIVIQTSIMLSASTAQFIIYHYISELNNNQVPKKAVIRCFGGLVDSIETYIKQKFNQYVSFSFATFEIIYEHVKIIVAAKYNSLPVELRSKFSHKNMIAIKSLQSNVGCTYSANIRSSISKHQNLKSSQNSSFNTVPEIIYSEFKRKNVYLINEDCMPGFFSVFKDLDKEYLLIDQHLAFKAEIESFRGETETEVSILYQYLVKLNKSKNQKLIVAHALQFIRQIFPKIHICVQQQVLKQVLDDAMKYKDLNNEVSEQEFLQLCQRLNFAFNKFNSTTSQLHFNLLADNGLVKLKVLVKVCQAHANPYCQIDQTLKFNEVIDRFPQFLNYEQFNEAIDAISQLEQFQGLLE